MLEALFTAALSAASFWTLVITGRHTAQHDRYTRTIYNACIIAAIVSTVACGLLLGLVWRIR
jgi:hypothetical protein